MMDEESVIKSAIFAFLFAVLAGSVIATSVYIIPTGERGVLLNWGVAEEYPITEGLHFKVPIKQKIVKMNVQTITVGLQGESQLAAASKDLQDVKVALIVNYHINPNDVVAIYSQYGNTYRQNVVEPIVRDTLKTTAAQFTAEELITKRAEFNSAVERALRTKLESKQASVETVSVVNVEFSQSFTQAIEAKVTAEQNALQAKNKLAQVEFESQQRITQATAEAEAIRIQAAAVTSQGGADYVQLQAINKWNGQLPQVTGGVMPFINLAIATNKTA